MTGMTTLLRRGPEGTAEPGPRVPPELIPPTEVSVRDRLRAWRQRHLLRERRAQDYFAASQRPERALPVADRRAAATFFGDLIRRRRGPVVLLLALHALAVMAGLAVPRILGRLVDQATAGGTLAATLNGLALAVAGVVLLQALMTFLALRTSAIFGQEVLANAREYVVRTVLALPLGRVESASSGDLVTRVTRDVGTMAQTIRFGLPETVIAIMTTLLTVAAMLLNSALLTLPLLVVAPLLIVAARRYLKRAPQGYITEGGTYSVINSTLTETVEGARTVEALGLQGKRIRQFDADIDVSAQA